jgi:purine-nucleoside phosphorylase
MFLPWGFFKSAFDNVDKAIICFPLPEFYFLKKFLNPEKILNWLNFKFFKMDKTLIIGPVIGAPATALLIEILKDLKVKKILGIGWAGSLRKEIKPGSLFFCEKAYSMEGTTEFYFKRKKVFFPSSELLKKFKKELKNFIKGNLVSIDAPFVLERNQELQKNLEKKFHAVDMETSAFFGVSQYYGIQNFIIHFVTDNIGKSDSIKPKKDTLQEDVMKRIIEQFLKL